MACSLLGEKMSTRLRSSGNRGTCEIILKPNRTQRFILLSGPSTVLHHPGTKNELREEGVDRLEHVEGEPHYFVQPR